MRALIDQHRETFGVEAICRVLQIAPSGIGVMPRRSGIRHAGAPGRRAMRP